MDAVAHDRADAEFPHLPCRVSDYPVIIFQHDAKTTVRIDFVNHAFERKELFFRQGLISRRKIDGRLLAILAVFDFIVDALIFVQSHHASCLHSRDVNEAVIAAAIRSDKAIAFVSIEEFYGAYGHKMFLSRNRLPHSKSAAWGGQGRVRKTAVRIRPSILGLAPINTSNFRRVRR